MDITYGRKIYHVVKKFIDSTEYQFEGSRAKDLKYPLENITLNFVSGNREVLESCFNLFSTNWSYTLKELHFTFDMLAYYGHPSSLHIIILMPFAPPSN